MDTIPISYLVLGLIITIISYVIIYEIIAAATKTSKKMSYEKTKIKLLILIAKKQGASDEEIGEALK